MPRDDLSITEHITIPMGELRFAFVRSQGPGGQNVNKVNSKAVLRWAIGASAALPTSVRDRFLQRYRTRINQEGDLILSSQRYRDQSRNVDDCLAKLQAMVLSVLAPPKRRRKTKPTRASRERRLKDKRLHSQKKDGRRNPRRDD